MSAPGAPPALFLRPATHRSQADRRARKKPAGLARAPPETKKELRKPSLKKAPRDRPKKSPARPNEGKKTNQRALEKADNTERSSGHMQRSALSGQEPSSSVGYSATEVSATGPLFPNPLALGFMKRDRNSGSRPLPRYMFNQPRLLVPPPFHQDPWDEKNQQKMLQIEQGNAGSDYQGVYEEFQEMREVERKKMEELGLVDAENTRKDLSDAIYFQGTCMDMCPIFERTRRSLENNVKALEKDPRTNKISRQRAIKAFSRPAAGQPPPMPSDVRPPHVLSSTLDYLITDILPHLPEAHSFVWDRTRSIRQDFIYQNYYGPAAIDCNERIVRIHLLSLHVMPGSDVEFSQQQELEQFNKALQTLTEIYQDVRHHGGLCPNEAEFRAYHLISHFRDSELERDLQTLPNSIFQHPMVQLAIVFRTLMSQNNIVERGYKNTVGATNLFVEFFRLVFDPKTPLLLAFLLETHFNEIRYYALKSLTRSYHTKGKAFSAQSLQQMLGFDTIDDLVSFVSYYDVDVVHENGEVLVDLCNKEKLEGQYKLNSLQAKPKRNPAHSAQLSKLLQMRNYKDLICAGHSNSDLHLQNLDTILERKPKPAKISSVSSVSQPAPLVPANLGFGGRVLPENSTIPQDNERPPQDNRISLGENRTKPQPFTFKPSELESSSALVQPPVEVPNTPFKFDEPKSFTKPSFGPENDVFSGVMSEEKEEKKKEKIKHEAMVPSAVFSVRNLEPINFLGKADSTIDFSKKTESPITSTQKTEPPIKFALKTEDRAPAKSIVENPRFPGAVEKVYESLMQETITGEISKVLHKLARERMENLERQKVIEVLSEELYQAFVSENLHKIAWEAMAKHFREHKLKKKALEKVRSFCHKLVSSQEQKRKRMAELENVHFKIPSLKRKKDNQEATKRPLVLRNVTIDNSDVTVSNDISFDNISERQKDLERLWTPMDLEPFAKNIANRLSLKTSLKVLLVVEDWKSSYSKWLNTKFNLRPSGDKTYYKHSVREKNLEVNFESLPKNIKSMENSFSNAPFFVFESGIFEDSQKTEYKNLQQKLQRDSEILHKLLQICDKFSLYKILLLIIVWDTTESDSFSGVQSFFETRIRSNVIQNIEVCCMTAQDNLGDLLHDKVMMMALQFKASLTERGVRKRTQLEMKRRRNAVDMELASAAQKPEARQASAALQEKETRALKKAKEQKHSFLSRHASFNKSVDLSNTSIRTANTSLANMTLNLNNSILGNNTFLQSNDVSFLQNYGTVKSRDVSFSQPHVPKRLQELRDLTASIKAKYVQKP